MQSLWQYEKRGFYWVKIEHWGERVLLGLKSVIHNPLKSVCRSFEAVSSFLSTPYFKILLFLIPCTLYLIPVELPVANAATITLGWDSNDEPDVEGYVVYSNRNSPGPPYRHSDTVPEDELEDPLHPVVEFHGLSEGREYYIALTAYNSDGVESDFSEEICAEVVNDTIQLCDASTNSSAATSSISGGGGGGSSGFACFISAASHSPSDKNLLLYILFITTAIGLGTHGYKKKL